MKKNKFNIDIKNNTRNYNIDILINNIKQNNEYIDDGYAQYLINCLDMLKDKSKKVMVFTNKKAF